MTENEAIKFIGQAVIESGKILEQLQGIKSEAERIGKVGEYYAHLDNCIKEIESCKVAIQALEEIQQYRAIETELRERYHANVDIKMIMQHFIETIFKGEKHEGFCILTNEDAKMWDEYKAIDTPEECRTAVERMKPKKPIDPMEDYGTFRCPTCNGLIYTENKMETHKNCLLCGQAIDWSE